jgi:hypothetical protein
MAESIYVRSEGPFLYDLLRKKFYAVKNGFVIGRVTGDLVFSDDTNMSRSHARIYLAGAGIKHGSIEDLGSTNGVLLNGVKLRVGQKMHLADGSTIEVGSQVFFFTYTQEIPPFSVERDPSTITAPPKVMAESTGASSAPTAAPPAAPKAKAPEGSQMTRSFIRPARMRPLDLHSAVFKTTDASGERELRIADISVSGVGLYRDPGFKWPASGSQLVGKLVTGESSQNVTLEILKKDPILVGCAFRVNAPEVKNFVEHYFDVELAAIDMSDQGGNPRTFRSSSCELRYAFDAGKLGVWQLILFGYRIDADATGKLKLSSQSSDGAQGAKQPVDVLREALRLLANIEELDEDARDALSAAVFSQLPKP